MAVWLTAEEIKDIIGIENEDEKLDDNLVLLEAGVRAILSKNRSYIISPGAGEEITEIQDGDDSPMIWTREYPIISIAELKICETAIPVIADYNDAGYRLTESGMRFGRIELHGYKATKGPYTVSIEYLPGHTTLPEAIKVGAARVIGALWKQQPYVGVIQNAGELSIQIADIIDKQGTWELLRPYWRMR